MWHVIIWSVIVVVLLGTHFVSFMVGVKHAEKVRQEEAELKESLRQYL